MNGPLATLLTYQNHNNPDKHPKPNQLKNIGSRIDMQTHAGNGRR